MRKAQVTDEDLQGLLGRMEIYGKRTEEVLSERIARPMTGHTIQIRIDQLDPDPQQPRKQFGEATLRDLSESIRSRGVLQPLVVRPAADRRYLIVAGERRFRAARLAGLEMVPCIVQEYSDEQALVIALIENVHRDDLTDMEKSDALSQLREMTGKRWDEVAELVHLSTGRVKNLAQLQQLAAPVKEQVRAHTLSGKKAAVLLPLPPAEQVELARQAAVEGLNFEQLQARARQVSGHPGRRSRKTAGEVPPEPVGATPVPAPSNLEIPDDRHAGVTIVPQFTEAIPVPAVVRELDAALDQAIRLLQTTGGLADAGMRSRLREKWLLLEQLMEPDES